MSLNVIEFKVTWMAHGTYGETSPRTMDFIVKIKGYQCFLSLAGMGKGALCLEREVLIAKIKCSLQTTHDFSLMGKIRPPSCLCCG